ncbi:interferon-inducible GTPase 5-like [Chiloscyllium plagiosum]|uniref:interferon-inducible GTPase 5-like n=1 Tax=Chiloscyllium plagiosum TaxID=36176 RepID=UPI001CB885A1|nr:interferon-inducible GTPase 5-like [Chiloscyllium plagiosum]
MLKPDALNTFVQTVQKQLEKFEWVVLQIAVTGEPTSGTSSFINSLRCVPDNEMGAAPTGVSVTVPTVYKFPNNNTLEIWQLPGTGAPGFQAAKYLKRVNFDQYDLLLILSADRFTENNLSLAEAVRKREKKVYFVCTETDSDPPGAEQHKATLSDPNLTQKVEPPNVYRVSGWKLEKYDFGNLLLTLAGDLSGVKKRAFLFAVPSVTAEIIEQKKVLMMNEIQKLALKSAVAAVLSIPGLSDACDITQLVSALSSYRKAFGLDEDSLRRLAKRVGKTPEVLRSVVRSTFGLEVTANVVKKKVVKTAGSGRLLATFLNFVPVVGQMGSATLTYNHTFTMLETAVREMAEDSKRLLHKALPPNAP